MSSYDDLIRGIRESINTELPCVVKEVNADGSVDVLVIRNDNVEDAVFPNVPVRHQESSSAYVYLGLSVGDRGLIRFLDKSIEGYKQNGIDIADERNHSLDDGVFDFGFYPLSEAYAFPKDKTIEIGNKDGSFKLSIAKDGSLDILASKVTLKASSVDVDGVVNLGLGGQPIARLGDEVTVGSVKGVISKAGVNTSL